MPYLPTIFQLSCSRGCDGKARVSHVEALILEPVLLSLFLFCQPQPFIFCPSYLCSRGQRACWNYFPGPVVLANSNTQPCLRLRCHNILKEFLGKGKIDCCEAKLPLIQQPKRCVCLHVLSAPQDSCPVLQTTKHKVLCGLGDIPIPVCLTLALSGRCPGKGTQW